jgi:phage I-like protein
MDMEARDDGLYLKPKWSAAGDEIIANAHYKWFSPLWGCADLARENGKRIVAPARLLSLGLTNNPVIEGILPLANEDAGSSATEPVALQNIQNGGRSATTAASANQTTKGITNPMKDKLLALFGLSNEATEEQILAAGTDLIIAKDTAETNLANEKTARAAAQTAQASESVARTTAETALANERKARIDLVLDNAITGGKITAAQRPQWASELEQNFDAKLVELANAKPVLNTESKTQGLGARNTEAHAIGAARIRQDKLLTLVNERMEKTNEDYETAFANIKRTKEGAALLAEMIQPQKK